MGSERSIAIKTKMLTKTNNIYTLHLKSVID